MPPPSRFRGSGGKLESSSRAPSDHAYSHRSRPSSKDETTTPSYSTTSARSSRKRSYTRSGSRLSPSCRAASRRRRAFSASRTSSSYERLRVVTSARRIMHPRATSIPAMVSPSAVGLEEALRGCWHPVAFTHDLRREPLARTLLEEPLVLWRDSAGTAHAFSDLCVHRGTALSLGSVADDEIVCPYHGWRYGTDGACTLVPQLEDPTRIPRKARARPFRCEERYGLVWVALDEPRWPLPEAPELEADE